MEAVKGSSSEMFKEGKKVENGEGGKKLSKGGLLETGEMDWEGKENLKMDEGQGEGESRKSAFDALMASKGEGKGGNVRKKKSGSRKDANLSEGSGNGGGKGKEKAAGGGEEEDVELSLREKAVKRWEWEDLANKG